MKKKKRTQLEMAEDLAALITEDHLDEDDALIGVDVLDYLGILGLTLQPGSAASEEYLAEAAAAAGKMP